MAGNSTGAAGKALSNTRTPGAPDETLRRQAKKETPSLDTWNTQDNERSHSPRPTAAARARSGWHGPAPCGRAARRPGAGTVTPGTFQHTPASLAQAHCLDRRTNTLNGRVGPRSQGKPSETAPRQSGPRSGRLWTMRPGRLGVPRGSPVTVHCVESPAVVVDWNTTGAGRPATQRHSREKLAHHYRVRPTFERTSSNEGEI